MPLGIDEQHLVRTTGDRVALREHVAQQLGRLEGRVRPAAIGAGHESDAPCALLLESLEAKGAQEGLDRRLRVRGRYVIARRRAAGDLQVEHAVLVRRGGPEELLDGPIENRHGEVGIQTDAAEGPDQSGAMLIPRKEARAPSQDDLVCRLPEQQSAILQRNPRRGEVGHPTVHPGERTPGEPLTGDGCILGLGPILHGDAPKGDATFAFPIVPPIARPQHRHAPIFPLGGHLPMPRLGLFILLLSLGAQAQSLSFNDVRGTVPVPLGSTLDITVQGQAGLPTWLALNTNPGPTPVGSASIPLAIDGNEALLIEGLPLGSGGVTTISLPVPSGLRFTGVTVFGAAIQLDPSAPGGLLIANGAAARLVRTGADAGQDDIALTGGLVVLDGRAGAVTDQPMWTVAEAPAGSAATLDDADTLTPTLRPDLAGRYVLALQTGGALAPSGDVAVIEAFDLGFTGPAQGSFHTTTFDVTGVAAGPSAFTLEVDGQPVSPGAGGAWTVAGRSASAPQETVTASIVSATGRRLARTLVVHGGSSLPLGSLATPGTSLRIEGATLDALEAPLGAALGALPLGQVLTALPPVPVVNTFFVSATFEFTTASFDPNVVVDLFPSNGAIGISVTINNLVVDAAVTGAIFGAPYAETATITTTSAVISGDLVIGSAANGALELQVQNENATLNGFNFAVTGVLGTLTQLGAIQSGIESALETALAGTLLLAPATLNPLLSNVPLTIDLGAQGIPVAVDFPLNSVVYDADGLTLATDLAVRLTGTAPPVLALQGVLSTPGPVPSFNRTTPSGGAYDAAVALNDDLLNQLLAGVASVGGLDLRVGPDGGPLGSPVLARTFAAILPGVGFESFDPFTPVTFDLVQATAPVVRFDATTGATVLNVSGASFRVGVVSNGREITLLDTSLTLEIGLALTLDPATGTLSFTPTSTTLDARYAGGLAGGNGALLLGGLGQLAPLLIPPLLAPLQGLPIPSLPGGGAIESGISPTTPDHFVLWLDIP